MKQKNKSLPIFGIKKPTQGVRRIAGDRIVKQSVLFIGGVSNVETEESFFEYIKEELKITPMNVSLNKEN